MKKTLFMPFSLTRGAGWPKIARSLGFGQRRCAHCMRPFFPKSRGMDPLSDKLCDECQKFLLPYLGPRCLKCGVPWGYEAFSEGARIKIVCPACKKLAPPWENTAYHGLYIGALRDLLLRLKFDGELHLASFFGGLLLEAARCLPAPDVIVAIPQHPGHLRSRGYNQAHEIARSLASLGGFRLDPEILARIRPGLPQEHLNASERRANLRNAFAASPQAAGAHVWLVDDVMTTGSTYREAAKALLDKGAAAVSALFVARTPMA